MLQLKRSLQLPLVGIILLGLLTILYLVTWMRRSSEPEPSVEKHKVETSSDDALKYWTKEKMRRAKPAKMPHVDTPAPTKPRTPHASQDSEPDRS